ncbi:aspartyl-phosphate phosphatase Spo0E family protein [Bacillus massiliigorillae]|nr:aspartyl-phosphate phosphatase Spo0E family protein [Bacillus massiliigorillae]
MISKDKPLKRRLSILVKQYGLTHPIVLKCSQELDKIIIEMQRRKYP